MGLARCPWGVARCLWGLGYRLWGLGLVRVSALFVAAGLSIVGAVVTSRVLAGVMCRVLGGPR